MSVENGSLSMYRDHTSLTYLTSDDRFVIKKISTSEKEFLINILPKYAEHLVKHPNSILGQILAVFSYDYGNFIVMTNTSHSFDGKPYETYELKGSTSGRKVNLINVN